MDKLDAILLRLGQHKFRAKFRLLGQEREMVGHRGMAAIRMHAQELIEQRLTPAEPCNDGRQTPYRGHPVFVAQHATAACCRNCLERWHGIPSGRALTQGEQSYVVDLICRWIERQRAPQGPPPVDSQTLVPRAPTR